MTLNFRLLLAALIVAGACLLPHKAEAACGAIPYSFTNSVSTVDAGTTNANNNHLQSCATNVDNTQIGAAGVFASQVIPTSLAQATFGGAFNYTFPTAITLKGDGSFNALFMQRSGTTEAQMGSYGTSVTVQSIGCGEWGEYGTTSAAFHICMDTNGDLAVAGELRGAHNPCSGTSGLPCSVQTNCTLNAGDSYTCSTTASVPANAICSTGLNYPGSSLLTTWQGAASAGTLTNYASGNAGGSYVATFNNTCD